MKAWRIVFGIAGIALLSFGIFRLLTEIPHHSLRLLALWLVAALVISDFILAPAVIAIAWLLRRYVPDRGRRSLQVGLIMSAMVTVVALPMIYLRGSQPPAKALLLRNYGANLALIIGFIAVLSLGVHLIAVMRDRHPSAPPESDVGEPATREQS